MRNTLRAVVMIFFSGIAYAADYKLCIRDNYTPYNQQLNFTIPSLHSAYDIAETALIIQLNLDTIEPITKKRFGDLRDYAFHPWSVPYPLPWLLSIEVLKANKNDKHASMNISDLYSFIRHKMKQKEDYQLKHSAEASATKVIQPVIFYPDMVQGSSYEHNPNDPRLCTEDEITCLINCYRGNNDLNLINRIVTDAYAQYKQSCNPFLLHKALFWNRHAQNLYLEALPETVDLVPIKPKMHAQKAQPLSFTLSKLYAEKCALKVDLDLNAIEPQSGQTYGTLQKLAVDQAFTPQLPWLLLIAITRKDNDLDAMHILDLYSLFKKNGISKPSLNYIAFAKEYYPETDIVIPVVFYGNNGEVPSSSHAELLIYDKHISVVSEISVILNAYINQNMKPITKERNQKLQSKILRLAELFYEKAKHPTTSEHLKPEFVLRALAWYKHICPTILDEPQQGIPGARMCELTNLRASKEFQRLIARIKEKPSDYEGFIPIL